MLNKGKPSMPKKLRTFLLWSLVLVVSIAACHWAYQRWLLRHTYDVYLSSARPGEVFFFSWEALERNKDEVREWFRKDFLEPKTVDEASVYRESKYMRILYHFGTEEDLEVLWQKAEMGYPMGPEVPDQVRSQQEKQSSLCIMLVSSICFACEELTGSKEEAIKMLEKGFQERDIAPEVREAYESLFGDGGGAVPSKEESGRE